uniref:BMERB domain-containing protein n=1 Tax=Anopheles atroparvus TaxID=41427 RepID=A0A182J0K9_ANOAO
GATDSEVNSTEISTDSEFDDEQPQRVQPTFHLEFKPLVEVDPTIKLVQAGRAPLAVPRPGDYGLSKTASTEGIASKKSLELKKKYLLGEGTAGLGVLKSGSASALDSKFKSFHSNITECQKLLNPAQGGGTGAAIPSSLRPGTTGVPDGGAAERQQTQAASSATEMHEDTEKENQYRADPRKPPANAGLGKRPSLVETINATLVENKLNEVKSSGATFQPAGTKEQDVPSAMQPSASPPHLIKAKPHNGLSDAGSNGLHINNNNNGSSNNNNGSSNNNNNNNNNESLEIIDLVTPEKTKGDDKGAGRVLGEKGNELKYIVNLKQAYLDLTTDSPNCDRSLVETTLDFSIAPASVNGGRAAEQSAPPKPGAVRIDSNENKIDASVVNGTGRSTGPLVKKEPLAPQQQQQPQGEEGCHETTLQVPTVPWASKKEEEDEDEAGIESDGISEWGSNRSNRSGSCSASSSSSSNSNSNSTSSVEDIPHFILDSTTSPETQNDERFVPRLEVRDATGELMQIDSLMIIDGRYIGDPEDLKLMEKLPPDTQIAAQMLQAEINQDSINTVVEGNGARLDGDESDERVVRAEKQQQQQQQQVSEEEGKDLPLGAGAEQREKPAEGKEENDDGDDDDDDDDRSKTPTPPMTHESDALSERAEDTNGRISRLSDFITKRNARFKFDAKNENKIDTLRNLPFVLEADRPAQPQKPKYLDLTHRKAAADADTDNERTPMASEPALPSPVVAVLAAALRQGPKSTAGDGDGDSDSQDDTEVTTQNNMTETELSDWAADDAVSENFVDIEFALNIPNRATTRRHQKLRQARLPQQQQQQQQQKRLVNGNRSGPAQAFAELPGAAEDGIIRNLALEDIEFMDTGSEEESCVETYSTTNRMMLRNRGYVEIMDPRVESQRALYPPPVQPSAAAMPLQVVEAINKQFAGRVDYIEQGSYLLATDDTSTPMNEEPPAKVTFLTLAARAASAADNDEGGAVAGTDGATLSTVPARIGSADPAPGDIDEDSLLMEAGSSTGTSAIGPTMTGSTTTTNTTTTEESEALTMVGVTRDSSHSSEVSIMPRVVTGDGSSSGQGSVTSFSSSKHDGRNAPSLPVRKVSIASLERKEVRRDSLKRAEDVGYEEYVKRLQHKIQQISNARDSLEVKKCKRKSSKGELLAASGPEDETHGRAVEQLDERAPSAVPPVPDADGTVPPGDLQRAAGQAVKSLEKKMEELALERVKQKDIIHDLVMDKLQTKKQLNAEKRLNRSRNRNNALLVGHVSASPGAGSIVGGAWPAAGEREAAGVGQRVLLSVDKFLASGVPEEAQAPTAPAVSSGKPQHGAYAGSVSMFRPVKKASPRKTVGDTSAAVAGHCSGSSSSPPVQPQLVTPRPRGGSPANAEPLTTDQLREEARSRARLKSNQDLGLSPEDRLLLLRKKYHINLRGLTDDEADDDDDAEAATQLNQSDDVKSKEQQQQQQHRSKLITSRSVNDVSLLRSQHHHHHPHCGMRPSPDDLPTPAAQQSGGKEGPAKLPDCVSDPNLSAHSAAIATGASPRRSNKRKDRERRKSIIEKVSDFFNGRKRAAENGAGSSKDTSPTKDGPAAPGPSNSGGGGGFLRFKISPKLKDKSKEKEGALYGRCASEDCLNSNTSNGSPAAAMAGPPVHGSAYHNSFKPIGRKEAEELEPPPIPPLPLNYQRSDDEFAASNEPNNEFKKMRAMSKTSRQAELKRLRIAQEIQREQEQIEVQINDLEARGVEIEKELRGESETLAQGNVANLGANDDGLVKEWLEIMSSITRLKVRDDELNIRQQELQLEHRHAQLKEELNMRLSFGKLDKNSSDVAAEGAILNEMLEIVAKRQALRPSLDAAGAAAATATSTSTAVSALPHSRVAQDTDKYFWVCCGR